MPIKLEKRSGQVMLLTVLFLSAIFLSATIVAGLLMVYQLSQVTKVADSAKAIFAADAAIERALFKVFRCNPTPVLPRTGSWNIDEFCNFAALPSVPDIALPDFFNDASYKLTIEGRPPTCLLPQDHCPNARPEDLLGIKSTGRAGNSARAYEFR